MNKIMYVPAIGEQFNSVWNRGLSYNNFDLKFFTKNSHFQHESALQSVYYILNGVAKNKSSYKEMIGYPKDKILFTDSAGFQIATFKKQGKPCNISPLDSLRLQEKNADIAFNLDVPPTLGESVTLNEFNLALSQSVDNFNLFEKNRQNYQMKLLNVIHGETIEFLDLWYNKVKHFNFDGWAIGVKPPFDPMLQALGFMYLLEKGEVDKNSCYNIHFFGTSGKNVVPTIAYASQKVNKKIMISYDSSSYNIGSIYRTYYMPLDVGDSLSFGEKFKIKNPNITTLPCECPVCKQINKIEDLNTKDIYAGTLISLHNMYQYIYYNNIINSLISTQDKFTAYLEAMKINKSTLTSFEFIDYAIENNVEKAFRKYKTHFQQQVEQKKKQTNVWGF
mgnify:CR=1 FL=1